MAKILADAWLEGLQPHARCLRGRRSGPVKIEPCGYSGPLDLETLIWTRGARYPMARLASRLKCPRCGGLAISLAWLPTADIAGRARSDLFQCVVARDGARAP